MWLSLFFFFSSRRRHTRCSRDWSSDVCSSDLRPAPANPTATRNITVGASAGCRNGMSRGAGFAIGLCLAAMQVAASAIAADDMTARRQSLEPYFRDYRPNGSGPFPAILLVSGCGSFAPRMAPQIYTDMAEGWRAKGYVVVFVDYLAARGRNRCPSIAAADLGKDVLVVASHLRTQPLIDPERVSAIGWSLGGSGVLAALDQIDPGERSPLHAVVAYYPVCGTLELWSVKV